MHTPDSSAVYIISVAARIVGMHVNTLRKYERQGLIAPARTVGNVRLFSGQDLYRLAQIKHLVEDRRVNLAGVEVALAVTDQILALRSGLLTGGSPDSENVCRVIDDVLKTLSAARAPDTLAKHPQEDADERRETHPGRRASTTARAERGRGGVIRDHRAGPATKGTGRRPGEGPDLP